MRPVNDGDALVLERTIGLSNLHRNAVAQQAVDLAVGCHRQHRRAVGG
jgi:hypothetical protein